MEILPLSIGLAACSFHRGARNNRARAIRAKTPAASNNKD